MQGIGKCGSQRPHPTCPPGNALITVVVEGECTKLVGSPLSPLLPLAPSPSSLQVVPCGRSCSRALISCHCNGTENSVDSAWPLEGQTNGRWSCARDIAIMNMVFLISWALPVGLWVLLFPQSRLADFYFLATTKVRFCLERNHSRRDDLMSY